MTIEGRVIAEFDTTDDVHTTIDSLITEHMPCSDKQLSTQYLLAVYDSCTGLGQYDFDVEVQNMSNQVECTIMDFDYDNMSATVYSFVDDSVLYLDENENNLITR